MPKQDKPVNPRLRAAAEAKLAQAPPRAAPDRSAEELLHELQVHQIELEMQNEALRQTQIALEESRDRYVDLYEFAPVGYLTLTAEGLISRINLTGASLLGVERKNLSQKRFASFIIREDRDRWHRHFISMTRHAGRGAVEVAMQRGDGMIFHAQLDSLCEQADADDMPIRAAGSLPWLRIALTDITERKALERQRLQREEELEQKVAERTAELVEAKDAAELANRAKSTFLANMSHELRTPLNVIIGLGYLLRRDASDPSAHHNWLSQLCATSDHLLTLVNDILDLSKIEAEHLMLDQCDFGLDTVLQQVARMIENSAQEKGLTLTTDVAPQLRRVRLHGDPLRLSQVLINLCGNAIKFTDYGSVRLGIACRAEAVDRVTLRFAIEDTGIGIPPDAQAQLFRPFAQADSSSTRERGGTGLGLAISQRLVMMMGGAIHVCSSPGTGSIFSFDLVLPRASVGEPEAATAPATSAATNLHGRHVLFAEDHPLSQEILFEMLEDLGCEVDVAFDGAEAVECARERSYDLILMDVQMPKMDGLAATRAIRTLPEHRDTPIIALTANAFVEDRQRCLEAGMNGHLGKPVTPISLATALSQWLPNLSVPDDETPACDNELSRALVQIAGLDVGPSWRQSPERLASYCTQLNQFITAQSDSMAMLSEHLLAGEHDAARVLAHQMKGIAGLMGVQRVASLAHEIEQGLRTQADESTIELMARECADELASLGAAVRALPASPVNPTTSLV